MSASFRLSSLLFAFGVSIAVIGCGPKEAPPGGDSTGKLTGSVKIDGSSTVYPVSQAVAEEFGKLHSGVSVTVNQSGTGGGFKKFSAGEIDICDASRPISGSEVEACAKGSIEFIELPVAYDGLTVVVHPENTFAGDLTVAELKKIWEPGSKVNNWKDVRAGFPDVPIKLFGAGTDSGTFDYFTEAIVGKAKSSRTDYTASEDDNVLVQGVAGEKGSLGYFGYSYYKENKSKVKAVKVNGVEPNDQTINEGTYQPLSRPLLIYVNKSAMSRPEVKEFVAYYLGAEGRELVSAVGYVKLPDDAYTLAKEHADKLKVGTAFKDGETVGMTIEQMLQREAAN